MGDWATDRIYDWADKMVNAAPSRCCIVVGGDLNAHVGYLRHPEREALHLEREVMAGCGEYRQVEANYHGERLAKFCSDQRMAMVNTYYPRGGPAYWNALGGREVASRFDYMLLPATRLQLVKTLLRPSKRGQTSSAHSPSTPTRDYVRSSGPRSTASFTEGSGRMELRKYRRHPGTCEARSD